jgi:hypothetical protein
MIRLRLAGALAAISAIAALGLSTAGCGDNSGACGPGTEEREGVCVPSGMVVCGGGTLLMGDQCVIDPGSCGSGTVLIGSRCVDPAGGLTVDLDESAEPNGLNIAAGVEASAAPAGTLVLRPSGQTLVVHGHLTPFRDADADGQLDPDVDTYLLTITEPTLLDVTVDGVGGALGAFYAVANPALVPPYERYGVSVTGDTARRRLFLPTAGRYAIAIADTRSIAIGTNPPLVAGAGAAAGGPTAEYYASFTVQPVPTATSIAITGGAGSQTGTLAAGEVKFFTAATAAGTSDFHPAMPGAATASVAVLAGNNLVGYAAEQRSPHTEASVGVTLAAGAMPVIAVDAVYNTGTAAEPFTLTIALR